MRFKTETGSEYEMQGALIRRVNTGAEKRGDGKWLLLKNEPHIAIGESALLELEPLAAYGPDDNGAHVVESTSTWRKTSWVTEIIND